MMPSIKGTVHIDTSALEFLKKAAPEKAQAAIKKIAFDMVRDIQTSFSTGKSAAGQPPGVDTGTLKNSINAKQTGEFEMTVSDGVEYGYFLEYGTGKMAARPFFEPAAERARRRLPDALRGVASNQSEGSSSGGEASSEGGE
jgi:HK97 gp10 family phage protein